MEGGGVRRVREIAMERAEQRGSWGRRWDPPRGRADGTRIDGIPGRLLG
jgi:hypothetical protein